VFYHIRRLRQIRHLVSRDVLTQLVTSLVLSRLDYCDAVLAGLPASTLAPLQHAQNAPARLALGLDRRSHITTALQKLHWLPVKYRVTFKIATIMHQTFHHRSDACRTSLTLSCLLRPTRMYANFAPARLEPLPSNEAGRSSEGAPSQWQAKTYGTVFPSSSVPSSPTQPSVVRSRHICSAQHLTISFYLDTDIVMHNRSIFKRLTLF